MNYLKNNIIIAVFFGLLLLPNLQLSGQTEEIIITKDYDGLSWKDFVEKLEKENNIRVFYNSDSIADIKVRLEVKSISLQDFLKETFMPLNIYPSFDKSGNVFLSKGEVIQTSLPFDFYHSVFTESKTPDTLSSFEKTNVDFLVTKKEFIAKTITLGSKKEGQHELKPSITGYIKSIRDSLPLDNVTLYIEELQNGTTSDENGRYVLNLDKGKYTLVVRSIESKTEKYKLNILSSDRFNIYLESNLFLLDEFVVSTEKEHNVKGTQMGFEKLAVKKINEIPVVLGERDIMKVALLLPGVQTVGEGSTGFNVRGSPADQNMFYINAVPVYNSSHLFGFFSAFNSDAVSDFTLLKSNIPASYGGRLASIFDITARQGNPDKFKATGGISPVTARLAVEGPIAKNKSSYLIGLRSTYSDWLFQYMKDSQLRKSSAWFGDAVVNLSLKINPSNELKLFGYYSYDDANIASLTSNNYRNMGGSLAWNHIIREKHTLTMTFASGNYDYVDKNMENDLYAYKQSYELNHNELKVDLTIRPGSKHTLSVGLNSILYQLKTGDLQPLDENSSLNPETFEPEKGIESGIYVSDQWAISPSLQIIAGLRYNLFANLGPKTVFTYRDGLPLSGESIMDTLEFSNNDIIKTYYGLDYRIAVRYIIKEDLSLKASYNKLHQYIFMLSNTIAISPADKWKLCDYNLKPMTGNQFSLGFYKNIFGSILEASVEGYYKEAVNIVEYKDGAELITNKFPETEVIQGKLKAHGLEFMVKKPYGKMNGWINYTWSSAQVLAANPATGEENNFGLAYPANYDKPHAVNLVANYKISRRISFSGNLVYSTGRPITYPTAIYYQDGNKIIYFSGRNEYRLPDYFRIDVSLNLEGNLKLKKFAHSSWNFSVYNLTGRKNAYSVYFKSEEGIIKGYRISIFGSPVFSVTYNFKLGNYEN